MSADREELAGAAGRADALLRRAASSSAWEDRAVETARSIGLALGVDLDNGEELEQIRDHVDAAMRAAAAIHLRIYLLGHYS